jgi:hypothetical protein
MGISQARATFLKCDLIHFISQIFVRLGAPLTISRLFMVSNCSIKLSFIQKISYKIVWPLSPNFSLNEILNAPSLWKMDLNIWKTFYQESFLEILTFWKDWSNKFAIITWIYLQFESMFVWNELGVYFFNS